MMGLEKRLSRRDVLKGTLAATSFSLAGSPLLGNSRQGSPSEKLNIAYIGIGNYGYRPIQELVTQNTVALCDVDWRPKAEFHGYGTAPADVVRNYPSAKRFSDWRIMLEKMDKEIDGVCVSTADHTHAGAVLTAMKMGKHVLCEKPLAHTVNEVRAMMAAERQYPHLATQTGIQGHVSEDCRMVVEWIRKGGLGTVKEVHVFQGGGRRSQSQHARPAPYAMLQHIHDKVPIPPEVKWDLWLGPAPYRPYNPMYLPARWRFWLDFGTGILGDHGPHFLDPVFEALDLGFPETIKAETDPGYDPETNKQTFPFRSIVQYQFPARGSLPALRVTWHGGDMPEIPAGWKTDRPFPHGGGMVVGTQGTLVYGPIYNGLPGASVPGMVTLVPEELNQQFHLREKSISPSKTLWMEWIECAKAGRQASADFHYGGVITQVCLMGDIAICLRGQILRFDAEAKKFTNSEDANRMFQGTYRPGWALPALG
jgi:predicted dehydrogenase